MRFITSPLRKSWGAEAWCEPRTRCRPPCRGVWKWPEDASYSESNMQLARSLTAHVTARSEMLSGAERRPKEGDEGYLTC